MKWNKVNEFSTLEVGDIISFVVDINQQPQNGSKYRVLDKSKRGIVLTNENLKEIEPWILTFNVFNEFTFFINS